jgi:hypothetical protein
MIASFLYLWVAFWLLRTPLQGDALTGGSYGGDSTDLMCLFMLLKI